MNFLLSVRSTLEEIGGKSLVKCLFKMENRILCSEACKFLVVYEIENLDTVSASKADFNT